MNRLGSHFREFWQFCATQTLVARPHRSFLLILGAVLIFAKGSALAPFIYSLF